MYGENEFEKKNINYNFMAKIQLNKKTHTHIQKRPEKPQFISWKEKNWLLKQNRH